MDYLRVLQEQTPVVSRDNNDNKRYSHGGGNK